MTGLRFTLVYVKPLYTPLTLSVLKLNDAGVTGGVTEFPDLLHAVNDSKTIKYQYKLLEYMTK
jgi:hypothetical protein